MRHDYPENARPNGAFIAAALTLFLVGVCGALAVIVAVSSW